MSCALSSSNGHSDHARFDKLSAHSVGELLGDDVSGRAQRTQRAYGTITRR